MIIGLIILSLRFAYNKKECEGMKFYISKLLMAIGMDNISKIESAWDYVFSELEYTTGSYMIITLKNGSVVYGLFAEKSFASLKFDGGDSIYLQDTFKNGDFEKSTGFGVYINGYDILTIDIDKNRIISEEESEEVSNEE